MLADNEIGGGRVRRLFSFGDKTLRAGHDLTGDQVRAIPVANRRALIDSGYLDIWPKMTLPETERHIVDRGKGKFDVIAGVKLNAEPLMRDAAEELATRPN